MKYFITLLLFAASLLPLPVFSQLNNGGLNANFGVDADTRSNWVKYGPLTGTIATDDWFSPTGSGYNVIDTSSSSMYLSLLKAGTNISFNKRMSALLYARLSGKLWLDAAYGRDFIAAQSLKDSTTFTISSKNGDNPSNWKGGTSSFPNKNDLVDVYAHMRRDGIDVHDSLWSFTGVSTFGTTGSSYYDVELYKNTFSYDPASGRFTSAGTNAGHTQWIFDASGNITQTGDMIIAVDFSPGSVPVIDLRIWVSQTTLNTVTPAYFNFTGSYDGASASPAFGYASIVSKSGTTAWGSGISNYSASAVQDTTYSTPWGTGSTAGMANWINQYQSQQFIEVGLNLTRIGVDPALYGSLSPCQSLFSNIFFKSRSSTSFTANMQDFMTPLVFLRDPVLDYSLRPDTLRCNHTTGNITLTSNTTAGYYTWQTANGSIIGTNSDSSQLTINKPGTYIVSAAAAQGCPASRKDTIVVPIDTFPPVASAFVGLSGKNLNLYGGDAIASNYPTPFGGSNGLTWNWSGPNAFSSSVQNPVTDTVWGNYQITVTENRNGCTDTASVSVNAGLFSVLLSNGLLLNGNYNNQSVNLNWEDLNESSGESFAIERMDENSVFQTLGIVFAGNDAGNRFSFTDSHPLQGINLYRIKAMTENGAVYYSSIIKVATDRKGVQNIYISGNYEGGLKLIANTDEDYNATLVIYNIAGQTLQKRNVSLSKGSNMIGLPPTGKGQRNIQVIVLFINDRIVFSQKAMF